VIFLICEKRHPEGGIPQQFGNSLLLGKICQIGQKLVIANDEKSLTFFTF